MPESYVLIPYLEVISDKYLKEVKKENDVREALEIEGEELEEERDENNEKIEDLDKYMKETLDKKLRRKLF
jgi:cell division protein FtsB